MEREVGCRKRRLSVEVSPHLCQVDTAVDLRVLGYMTIRSIHEKLAKVLRLPDQEIGYRIKGTNKAIDIFETVEEAHLEDGTTLLLCPCKNQPAECDCFSMTTDRESETNLIVVLCTTRILDTDGEVFRNIRVVVNSAGPCKFLMEDVGSLWRKRGLKFKFGRTVLSPEKTFRELGIIDGSEIVITGGRS